MRMMRVIFILTICAIVLWGPYAYILYRKDRCRNFRVVREGVLYRSGQMSVAGLARIVREYGIKTVVTLRYSDNPDNPPPDAAEEKFCKDELLNHCRIPYRPWWASDGTVPADIGVKTFLKAMNDPKNYPVLIHCFAGIHRTGAFCAAYRMEFDRWTNTQAIQEMRNLGYTDEHLDVLTYLENYHARGIATGSDAEPVADKIRPASHEQKP